SVFTVFAERVAGPETLNCTGTPTAALLLLVLSFTMRGPPKLALAIAVWPSPDRIERPVTVIFGIAVAVKVNFLVASLARVAVTCTAPLAEEAKVRVLDVCPVASVVVLAPRPSVAAPEGLTDQLTFCPASGVPAVESTSTTSAAARLCPACACCELPEINFRAPGVPGVTD